MASFEHHEDNCGVTQYGVATEVLYLAVKSGDSEEAVAEWFEVDRQAIRDAIEFEERLAA